MKKILFLIIVFSCVLFLSVCSQAQTVDSGITLKQMLDEANVFVGTENTLPPKQAYEKIQSTPNLMIIDVDTKFEFDKGHIKNSILIPRGLIEFKITKNDIFPEINQGKMPEKTTPIFLYCKMGGRCLLAAQTLKKMGYTEVYNLKGGLNAWKTERLPLEMGNAN